MKVKDNINLSAAQIKRLATQKAVPVDSDSYAIHRFPLKNKDRTVLLATHKKQGNNTPNQIFSKCYCVMYNKYGIPECKYKLHIPENYLGIGSTRNPSSKSWGKIWAIGTSLSSIYRSQKIIERGS